MLENLSVNRNRWKFPEINQENIRNTAANGPLSSKRMNVFPVTL